MPFRKADGKQSHPPERDDVRPRGLPLHPVTRPALCHNATARASGDLDTPQGITWMTSQ